MSQKKYILKEAVVKEIERVFDHSQWEVVKEGLSNTAIWSAESAPVPRVHIAFIRLSKGDTKILQNYLNYHQDWRDALLDSGLSNEDWREKLLSEGVDCSDW